jgi:hypothetical protein
MSLPERRSNSYKAKKSWLLRYKYVLKALLNRFPLIGSPIIQIWRNIKWLLLQYRWKMQINRSSNIEELDIDKLLWISPQRITYCSLREFGLYSKGSVIGGDWDHLEKKFQDLDIYIALRQVCIEGNHWSQTIFYKRIIERLNKGEILWGCKDKHQFDLRCKNLEDLFHKIKAEGYKSQHELSLMQKGSDYDPMSIEDEVMLSIGRNGDFLFSDGAHRLSISKLLGIQTIPVKIAARHTEWMKFRKELLIYAMKLGGKIYQPIIHPDLSHLPSFHVSEKRFTMIRKNLSIDKGRMLDIGANLGYFCHRFEDEGFDCYAIEDSPLELYFLKKLKRAENKKFKVITESTLNSTEVRNIHFDVILALNIFHHFLKTEESSYKFIDLLKHIQVRELFFQPHLPDESQMENTYKNYNSNEFVNLILDVCKLKTARLLGEDQDGRELYRLH